jgi:hypothetical protein
MTSMSAFGRLHGRLTKRGVFLAMLHCCVLCLHATTLPRLRRVNGSVGRQTLDGEWGFCECSISKLVKGRLDQTMLDSHWGNVQ